MDNMYECIGKSVVAWGIKGDIAKGELIKVLPPREQFTEEEVKLYTGEPAEGQKPFGNTPIAIPRVVIKKLDGSYVIIPMGRDVVVELED